MVEKKLDQKQMNYIAKTNYIKQINKLKVHLVLFGMLRDNESLSSVPMDIDA